MTTIRKVLEDYVKKGLSKEDAITKVISKTGAKRDSVVRMYRDVTGGISRNQRNKPGVYNRDQFKQQYDEGTKVRIAINKGLDTLKDEEIVEDSVFRSERCGLGATTVYRQITNEPGYAKSYQFQIGSGGKRFWSTPDGREWAIQKISKAIPI